MKKNNLLLFLSFFLIPTISYSANIAVVNIDELINTNNSYIMIINDIEEKQKKYLSIFNEKENTLNDLLVEIENSKLILEKDELDNMINNYNFEYNKFSLLVEDFNSHYNNEIIKIRTTILEELVILIEKYSNDNNIDIVIDANNYLIASNKINITNFIKNELNKIKFELDYKNFETN